MTNRAFLSAISTRLFYKSNLNKRRSAAIANNSFNFLNKTPLNRRHFSFKKCGRAINNNPYKYLFISGSFTAICTSLMVYDMLDNDIKKRFFVTDHSDKSITLYLTPEMKKIAGNTGLDNTLTYPNKAPFKYESSSSKIHEIINDISRYRFTYVRKIRSQLLYLKATREAYLRNEESSEIIEELDAAIRHWEKVLEYNKGQLIKFIQFFEKHNQGAFFTPPNPMSGLFVDSGSFPFIDYSYPQLHSLKSDSQEERKRVFEENSYIEGKLIEVKSEIKELKQKKNLSDMEKKRINKLEGIVAILSLYIKANQQVLKGVVFKNQHPMVEFSLSENNKYSLEIPRTFNLSLHQYLYMSMVSPGILVDEMKDCFIERIAKFAEERLFLKRYISKLDNEIQHKNKMKEKELSEGMAKNIDEEISKLTAQKAKFEGYIKYWNLIIEELESLFWTQDELMKFQPNTTSDYYYALASMANGNRGVASEFN